MKINNLRGELTYISAKKEALVQGALVSMARKPDRVRIYAQWRWGGAQNVPMGRELVRRRGRTRQHCFHAEIKDLHERSQRPSFRSSSASGMLNNQSSISPIIEIKWIIVSMSWSKLKFVTYK